METQATKDSQHRRVKHYIVTLNKGESTLATLDNKETQTKRIFPLATLNKEESQAKGVNNKFFVYSFLTFFAFLLCSGDLEALLLTPLDLLLCFLFGLGLAAGLFAGRYRLGVVGEGNSACAALIALGVGGERILWLIALGVTSLSHSDDGYRSKRAGGEAGGVRDICGV